MFFDDKKTEKKTNFIDVYRIKPITPTQILLPGLNRHVSRFVKINL